jgi:hypothetical protein
VHAKDTPDSMVVHALLCQLLCSSNRRLGLEG